MGNMPILAPSPLLFVLGMHRSGTSALCSALEYSGASFGGDLLEPMVGVNEEGFWENASVVALNQQLLERLGGTWFCPPSRVSQSDWSDDALADIREAARAILRRGFGGGPVQAVKDPRLCITLPLWLAAAAEVQIPTTVCVISRAPLEVARSLHKRDGFPLGYGVRLYAQYREQLAANVPSEATYVTYDTLLQDPKSVLQVLARVLPLTVPDTGLEGSVKPQLRHHSAMQGDRMLLQADTGDVDLAALNGAIEQAYPSSEVLREFALSMAKRAEQLTSLGDEHTQALAVLTQRDADIEGLSALHREALAMITQRDADIEGLSAEHNVALDTLRERDQQLQRLLAIPGLGLLIRAMKWFYARR
jgi:hypothetical protein